MQTFAKVMVFIIMVTVATLVLIIGFLKAMKTDKPKKVGILTGLLVTTINLIGSVCVTII